MFVLYLSLLVLPALLVAVVVPGVVILDLPLEIVVGWLLTVHGLRGWVLGLSNYPNKFLLTLVVGVAGVKGVAGGHRQRQNGEKYLESNFKLLNIPGNVTI
jgi:hypothetical protein